MFGANFQTSFSLSILSGTDVNKRHQDSTRWLIPNLEVLSSESTYFPKLHRLFCGTPLCVSVQFQLKKKYPWLSFSVLLLQEIPPLWEIPSFCLAKEKRRIKAIYNVDRDNILKMIAWLRIPTNCYVSSLNILFSKHLPNKFLETSKQPKYLIFFIPS